jgi:hypothetical protein
VHNRPRAADAAAIAEMLRTKAAECLKLADSETRRDRREGFLSLAHSYETTAAAILHVPETASARRLRVAEARRAEPSRGAN